MINNARLNTMVVIFSPITYVQSMSLLPLNIVQFMCVSSQMWTPYIKNYIYHVKYISFPVGFKLRTPKAKHEQNETSKVLRKLYFKSYRLLSKI